MLIHNSSVNIVTDRIKISARKGQPVEIKIILSPLRGFDLTWFHLSTILSPLWGSRAIHNLMQDKGQRAQGKVKPYCQLPNVHHPNLKELAQMPDRARPPPARAGQVLAAIPDQCNNAVAKGIRGIGEECLKSLSCVLIYP